MATTIVNNFISPRTPFEMVIKTDNLSTGSTANNQFRIPHGGGSNALYNYKVDWGDGVIENVVGNTSPIHTYASIGTYTVKILGIFSGTSFGSVEGGGAGDILKLLTINSWDARQRWRSFTPATAARWFMGCNNLSSIPEYIPAQMIETQVVSYAFQNSGISFLPEMKFPLNTSASYIAQGAPITEIKPGTNWGDVITVDRGFAGSRIVNFPALDFRKSTNFTLAFSSFFLVTFGACQFRDVPLLSGDAIAGFRAAWQNCSNLANFPPNMFDDCATLAYRFAFTNCALTQQSVDNILVSVNVSADNSNLNNGWLSINGGTNATPSATGQTATDSLRARGWTVELNGY